MQILRTSLLGRSFSINGFTRCCASVIIICKKSVPCPRPRVHVRLMVVWRSRSACSYCWLPAHTYIVFLRLSIGDSCAQSTRIQNTRASDERDFLIRLNPLYGGVDKECQTDEFPATSNMDCSCGDSSGDLHPKINFRMAQSVNNYKFVKS